MINPKGAHLTEQLHALVRFYTYKGYEIAYKDISEIRSSSGVLCIHLSNSHTSFNLFLFYMVITCHLSRSISLTHFCPVLAATFSAIKRTNSTCLRTSCTCTWNRATFQIDCQTMILHSKSSPWCCKYYFYTCSLTHFIKRLNRH